MEYYHKLWNAFYDSTMGRNDIVNNVLEGINTEQWASYVDYRLRPETMRKKTKKTVSWGQLWNMTHKKKDESFVNDEAENIGKEIDKHLSLRENNYSENSPNVDVGVVFGKEHPDSVRGLGMRVVLTMTFKHTTPQLGAMNLGSSSANTSSPDLRQKNSDYGITITSIVCLHCYKGKRKAP